MSRYIPGNPHSDAGLEAAARWRDTCLVGHSSLLGGGQLWQPEIAAEVKLLFVDNLIETNESFMEKLKQQFENASPKSIQLLAEIYWVLNLFPSNMGGEIKRDQVQRIWSWSGERLSDEHPSLNIDLLSGFGSGGPGFLNHRWRELRFLILLLVDWLARPIDEQHDILSDPWQFAEWVESIPDDGTRQMRRILPFLLFPDTFERIAGSAHFRSILEKIGGIDKREVRGMLKLEQDRKLFAIRQQLEEQYGEPIDFYRSPIVELWKEEPEDKSSFADRIQNFFDIFSSQREAPFQINSEMRISIKYICEWLETSSSLKDHPNIQVKMSVGQGAWTRTPWIALLDNRVTTSTQRGTYIVLLFSEDLSVVYLTLNQGMTDLVNKLGQRGAVEEMLNVADQLRPVIKDISEFGFELDNKIDLRSTTTAAKNYEVGTIAHTSYEREALPDDETLNDNLATLLNAYDLIISGIEAPTDNNFPQKLTCELYTVEDAMKELFLPQKEFEQCLEIWRHKKNIILQGAPGVGKSFVAKRLAYALVGSKNDEFVEAVQFHQSYSYEDFVQGYRPDGSGGFKLQDGLFYRFRDRAIANPKIPYVFIIDEINRGNLSKIFGELMLLIEADKRGKEWKTRLSYAMPDDEPFYIPENLYILGMMNTADKSLSLVDYALRRRFSFVTLEPMFQSQKFREELVNKGVSDKLVSQIVVRMNELNQEISSDRVNLGPGFQIGHSFFTPRTKVADEAAWFRRVVETEVYPLLEEYWFDSPEQADLSRDRLFVEV
jgi:hypothetical protein